MSARTRSLWVCASALAMFSGLALGGAIQGTGVQGEPKRPQNSVPTTAPTKPGSDQQGPGAKNPATPTTAPERPSVPGMDQEAMDQMMELGQPGEMHKKLEPMVGRFDAVTRFWMMPGTPPMESKGSAEAKWVMDGRFIEMTYTGDMMGLPFKGTGLTGYNRISKQFESLWVDSMTTGMAMSTGSMSDDGKSITWTGEYDDPMTSERKKNRSVTRFVDANTHIYEMYDKGPDGKEFKQGEIVFTRAGGAPANTPSTTPSNTGTAPGGKR